MVEGTALVDSQLKSQSIVNTAAAAAAAAAAAVLLLLPPDRQRFTDLVQC